VPPSPSGSTAAPAHSRAIKRRRLKKRSSMRPIPISWARLFITPAEAAAHHISISLLDPLARTVGPPLLRQLSRLGPSASATAMDLVCDLEPGKETGRFLCLCSRNSRRSAHVKKRTSPNCMQCNSTFVPCNAGARIMGGIPILTGSFRPVSFLWLVCSRAENVARPERIDARGRVAISLWVFSHIETRESHQSPTNVGRRPAAFISHRGLQ